MRGKYSKKLPNTSKMLPKWWFFAKSGRTGEIYPNLVTLFATGLITFKSVRLQKTFE